MIAISARESNLRNGSRLTRRVSTLPEPCCCNYVAPTQHMSCLDTNSRQASRLRFTIMHEASCTLSRKGVSSQSLTVCCHVSTHTKFHPRHHHGHITHYVHDCAQFVFGVVSQVGNSNLPLLPSVFCKRGVPAGVCLPHHASVTFPHKDAKKVLVKPSTTPAVALAAIIGRVTQSVVTLNSGPPQPELEALVGHVEPGQALDRTVDMKKDQVRVHGFSCPICIV